MTSLVIYAQRLRGTTEDDVLLEAMLRDSALIMKDPAVLSAISANQILAKDMRVLLSLLKQRGHGKTVLYSRLASLVPLHSRLWFGR